jgi:3D (Asp-Asp-Asp) domain-containing protein
MFSCAPEVVLTNPHPSKQRRVFRLTGLCAIAIFAISIQYQPSAALPLMDSKMTGYRTTVHDATLFAQLTERAFAGVTWRNALAVDDAHSLLTTPKIEPMPTTTETADLESLSIHTEVRMHRAFTPVRVVVRFTTDMTAGSKKVVRRGQPGIAIVTERVTLWNTVVVDRQKLSRVVVQPAQAGLIIAGPPRSVAEAMAVTGVHKLVAVYAMVATAYTADSAQAVPTGRTATGLPARYGVVAVDPRVIPLGSRLFIQGYGTAIAADTGGAIRGNRIDLCMDSLRSAINWGRQPVKVYVLQE